MVSFIKSVFLVLLAFVLSSCAPGIFFGASVGAGTVLSKEKTIGNTIDDSTIWTRIKAAFISKAKHVNGVLTSVSVEVSEGRVLLTGFVEKPSDRVDLVKIVWNQTGVKEVINKIKLKSEKSSNSNSYTSDTLITSKVKSKMIVDKRIRYLNFDIQTIEGVTYIIGIARNHEEISAIEEIINSIPEIKKFENCIKVPVSQEHAKPSIQNNKNLNQSVKNTDSPQEEIYDLKKQKMDEFNQEHDNTSNKKEQVQGNQESRKQGYVEEINPNQDIDEAEIEIEQTNE